MDGSSLATVESATLTQGVSFLYAQAGELLRRRREARDRASAAREQRGIAQAPAAASAEVPAAVPGSLPQLLLPGDVFDAAGGALPEAAPATLDRLAASLLAARRDVDDYVLGMASLGGDSQAGLEAADRLRCLLEEVYGSAVTFRGEQRTAGRRTTYVRAQDAGVVAGGSIHAKYIAGHDINVERS
jgi:hypothetical protein